MIPTYMIAVQEICCIYVPVGLQLSVRVSCVALMDQARACLPPSVFRYCDIFGPRKETTCTDMGPSQRWN
jgi:hypothetical protein